MNAKDQHGYETEEVEPSNLLVSFRGKKIEMPFFTTLTVGQIQESVVSSNITHNDKQKNQSTAEDLSNSNNWALLPSDIKILHKGKQWADPDQNAYQLLLGGLDSSSKKKPSIKPIYRLMATGVSAQEAKSNNKAIQEGMRNAPRIRDDISHDGRLELARRQRLGRAMMHQMSKKDNTTSSYCFSRIETIPMLPDREKAKQILHELASDRGVLACMAKHKWSVGSLAELFPEGKVGESEVCVMGLNKNKGQQILLRIRTDDLKGFRKMLSIRKVLFHELAHNVHSEHNQDFFVLMRQIERECNNMDWTQSQGYTTGGSNNRNMETIGNGVGDWAGQTYQGGIFRLGGDKKEASSSSIPVHSSKRELAARAAMRRMTKEEEQIQYYCGCNKEVSVRPTTEETRNEQQTTNTTTNIGLLATDETEKDPSSKKESL